MVRMDCSHRNMVNRIINRCDMIYEKHYKSENYIERIWPNTRHSRIAEFYEVNFPRSGYHMLKRIRNRINLMKNGKSYGTKKRPEKA